MKHIYVGHNCPGQNDKKEGCDGYIGGPGCQMVAINATKEEQVDYCNRGLES